MKIIAILMCLIIASCSSGPTRLSDEGKNVKVVLQKPSKCEVAGNVEGKTDSGIRDVAMNEARNKAADMDATHLMVKETVTNGKNIVVLGIAYQCE